MSDRNFFFCRAFLLQNFTPTETYSMCTDISCPPVRYLDLKQTRYSLYREGDRLTLVVDNPDEKTSALLRQVAVNSIDDMCGFDFEGELALPQKPKGFSEIEIKEFIMHPDRAAQMGPAAYVRKAEETLDGRTIGMIYARLGIRSIEEREEKIKDLANQYGQILARDYIRLHGDPRYQHAAKPKYDDHEAGSY